MKGKIFVNYMTVLTQCNVNTSVTDNKRMTDYTKVTYRGQVEVSCQGHQDFQHHLHGYSVRITSDFSLCSASETTTKQLHNKIVSKSAQNETFEYLFNETI